MKRLGQWGLWVFLATGMVSAALLTGPSAQAGKARGAASASASAAAVSAEPPNVKNRAGIELKPEGLHWDMSEAQVIQLYERIIDSDYAPLYQKAQPGPETTRLDSAVANAKEAFRRSRVEFGNLPTGVDSTPLKGEYTYRNQESMMRIARRGAGVRYFFFIRGKLWKVYDEVGLVEDGPLGPNFEEAQRRLANKYGVAGRVTEPDYAVNRNFRELDWQDPRTHLRALDRSGLKTVALVYEDRATLSRLASLRTNQPEDQNKLDPEIEALVRPPAAPPGPPPESKDKKKPGSKK